VDTNQDDRAVAQTNMSRSAFDAAKSIFDRKGGWHRVMQLSGRQPRVVEHVRSSLE
jgi:hypothetical protein